MHVWLRDSRGQDLRHWHSGYHSEWFIDIYQEWIDQRQHDDRWSIKCQIKAGNQLETWFFQWVGLVAEKWTPRLHYPETKPRQTYCLKAIQQLALNTYSHITHKTESPLWNTFCGLSSHSLAFTFKTLSVFPPEMASNRLPQKVANCFSFFKT